MDDLALQQELEALAGNAYNPPSTSNSTTAAEPISTTMSRWHTLFNLSSDDAIDRIMEHRNNLTRPRISDDHWEAIRSSKEAEGYDREAYEYELGLRKKKAMLPSLLPASEEVGSGLSYLVELGGPLSSLEAVQEAAGLETTPERVEGWSVEDARPIEMCIVSSEAKRAILKWASKTAGGFEPTILVNPKSMQ